LASPTAPDPARGLFETVLVAAGRPIRLGAHLLGEDDEVLEAGRPNLFLVTAGDLFLTSSLRGIRPVRSLDGNPLEKSDPLVERLAGALRRRWLDEGSRTTDRPSGAGRDD
jgi:hypothetical protein